MVQINLPAKRKRSSRRQRMVRHSIKTDMTPMVDLGFLLITFFVITAEMTKPTVANLNMPTQGPPTPVRQSDALTVLLSGNNTVFYYEGDWDEAQKTGNIFASNYSERNGLGKVIRGKQQRLDRDNAKGEGRNGLLLLIKPDVTAAYQNVTDLLDEIAINDVKKYAIINLTSAEKEYLKVKIQK